MKVELPEIRPEERTPFVEALLDLLRQVLDRAAQLEEANQHLRDEIAQLKGQKPRPTIQPSVLERPAGQPVDRGVKEGQFRGLGGGRLELPGEADGTWMNGAW